MTDEINIVLRFNPEAEEVELVVGDEVAGSSGKDEFKSWVEHYNEKHPEVVVQEVKPAEQVVVPPAVPVVEAGPVAVETPPVVAEEVVVDKPAEV